MNRRVLLIACMLSLPLAYSAVSAQGGGAASQARPVNQAQKDTTASKDSVSAKGLDLDKLLVADEEGDLLIEDKPAAPAKAVASDSAATGQVSNKAGDQSVDEGESVKSADSAAHAPRRTSARGRRGPPPSKTSEVAADVGPVIVEEGRTINFAQNLKEYKSPRLAMLLSLLVPGLGQAYSRSYIKATAFGAAEVAAIGVAVYLNTRSKSERRKAYDYADENFSPDDIKRYYDTLRVELLLRDSSSIDKDSIFLPYDSYFEEAVKSKSSHYYESIRDEDFTPGWVDCDPMLDSLLVFIRDDTRDAISGKNGEYVRWVRYDQINKENFYYIKRIFDDMGRPVGGNEKIRGYSNYQIKYKEMMDKSDWYRDALNYTFYVMILNHIASAIDAGFTARAHNARLLGEDNSAWNRISVEQKFVFTGSELSPGVALRLRF